MSNGASERNKPPRARDHVSLDEAATLLGMTADEVRAELVREISRGGELTGGIRVPRTLIARLRRPRPA